MSKKKKTDVGMANIEDMPPMLHIDARHLPEIKNWKVGETYTLTLKAKMTSLNESQNEGNDSRMSAGFEIQEADAGKEMDANETKAAKISSRIKKRSY